MLTDFTGLIVTVSPCMFSTTCAQSNLTKVESNFCNVESNENGTVITLICWIDGSKYVTVKLESSSFSEGTISFPLLS